MSTALWVVLTAMFFSWLTLFLCSIADHKSKQSGVLGGKDQAVLLCGTWITSLFIAGMILFLVCREAFSNGIPGAWTRTLAAHAKEEEPHI